MDTIKFQVKPYKTNSRKPRSCDTGGGEVIPRGNTRNQRIGVGE